jgi:chitodextrinase
MSEHYRGFPQRNVCSSVFGKGLTTALALLLLLKGAVSLAQPAATVAVSSTQAGISTKVMGMQGNGPETFPSIDDLGVNSWRYYLGMDNFEPVDDKDPEGFPTTSQLKAAGVDEILNTTNLINWPAYEAILTKSLGDNQTHGLRFQTFRNKGVRVFVNVRPQRRGDPAWAPDFAPPAVSQADRDEWWQYVYTMVLLFNKKHDYRIDDWELGNEPDLPEEGFKGNQDTYYVLVSVAADAIREAYSRHLGNRAHRIYGPATASDNQGWITGTIANVGSDFDHVSYHKYDVYRSLVQSTKNVNGWAGPGREVWLTEWGSFEGGLARNGELPINIQWIKFIMNMSTPGDTYVDGWHYYQLHHTGYRGGDGLIDKRTTPGTKEKMYFGLRQAVRALNGGKPVFASQASTGDLSAITARNASGTYNTLITNTSSSTAYRVEINLSALAANVSQTTLYRFDATNNDRRFRGPVLGSTGRATVTVPPNGAVAYVTGSSTWSTDPADLQDTQAPGAVTGLAPSAATATTTHLTWNPATDNVGVISYNIYAGATLRATVNGTSYTVTNLNPGATYSYTVKALDGMGNESAPSSVSFTTVAAGSVTRLAVNLGDAHVQEGRAADNLGGETTIKVKAGSGYLNRKAYLKFDLAGVAAVKRAILRVYGTNRETGDPIKLSAFETSDGWGEGTITWNNAPAAIGAKAGEVDVTNAAGYWQMDVTDYVKAQLAGDKVVSLVLVNAENQNQILEFNSRENAANKPELVISSDAATAFQQSTAADGLVSMEAEHYTAKADRGTHAWTRRDELAGDSGTGAVQATPDNGTVITGSIASTSPELTYRVNFTRTGTHYVWIRGYATVPENNSLHAGLDGAVPGTSDNIETNTFNAWVWISDSRDGGRVTLNVATPGLHTFSLYMREDGFTADKIVLTTDANYVPAGAGPAESSKTSGGRVVYNLGEAAGAVSSVLQVHPVPATDQLTLSYQAARAGTVSITLSDARAVAKVTLEKPVARGQNHIRVNVATLPGGLYLLRLGDGARVLTRKVVIAGILR